MTLATADVADIPRRTWRQWRRQLPAYWRIAARAFLILAVLNLIVLAKLIIGEIEPAHVRALRKPGQFIDVEYAEDKLPIRDFRLRRWVSRLKWRSRYEVKSLALGPDLNDRDLCRLSAAIFPMWWN
jgi:hypothetical protein